MKKDIFNGYVKEENIKYVRNSLIFFTFFLIFTSVALFLLVLFDDAISGAGKTALLIVCPIVFTIGILYPIITIALIRSYPKHKKLTKLFIAGFVLKDND